MGANLTGVVDLLQTGLSGLWWLLGQPGVDALILLLLLIIGEGAIRDFLFRPRLRISLRNISIWAGDKATLEVTVTSIRRRPPREVLLRCRGFTRRSAEDIGGGSRYLPLATIDQASKGEEPSAPFESRASLLRKRESFSRYIPPKVGSLWHDGREVFLCVEAMGEGKECIARYLVGPNLHSEPRRLSMLSTPRLWRECRAHEKRWDRGFEGT